MARPGDGNFYCDIWYFGIDGYHFGDCDIYNPTVGQHSFPIKSFEMIIGLMLSGIRFESADAVAVWTKATVSLYEKAYRP